MSASTINKLKNGCTEVVLSHLDSKDPFLRPLAEAMRASTTLRSLSMGYSRLNGGSGAWLARALQGHQSLTQLTLDCSNIDWATLLEALKDVATLTDLSAMNDDSIDEVLPLIFDTSAKTWSLTRLSVERIYHPTNSIAELLPNDKVLRTLVLRDSRLKLAHRLHFASAIELNDTLTSLTIVCCKFGDKAAIKLAKALAKNRAVTFLSLGENDLGDASAVAFAEALADNSTLVSLCLENNKFHDEGSTRLLHAFENSNSLIALNIMCWTTDPAILERIHHLNTSKPKEAELASKNRAEQEKKLADSDSQKAARWEAKKRRKAREKAKKAEAARRTAFVSQQASLVSLDVIRETVLAKARQQVTVACHLLECDSAAWDLDNTSLSDLEAARVYQLAAAVTAYWTRQDDIVAAGDGTALADAVQARDLAVDDLRHATVAVTSDLDRFNAIDATLLEKRKRIEAALWSLERIHVETVGHDARGLVPEGATLLSMAVAELTGSIEQACASLATCHDTCEPREAWNLEEGNIERLIGQQLAVARQMSLVGKQTAELLAASAAFHDRAANDWRHRFLAIKALLRTHDSMREVLARGIALVGELEWRVCPEMKELLEAEENKKNCFHSLSVLSRLSDATMLCSGEAMKLLDGEQSFNAFRGLLQADMVIDKEIVLLAEASQWHPELLHSCVHLEGLKEITRGSFLEDYDVTETVWHLLEPSLGNALLHKRLTLCTREGTDLEGDRGLCLLKSYAVTDRDKSARRVFLRDLSALKEKEITRMVKPRALFFGDNGRKAFLEFEPHVCLASWLCKAPRSEEAVQSLLRQMLEALVKVHSMEKVHGAIDSSNVFVTDCGSRCLLGPMDNGTLQVTVEISEVLPSSPPQKHSDKNNCEPNAAADMLAFALVAFDALFPTPPEGPARRPSQEEICEGYEVAIPAHPSEELRQSLGQLLAARPSQRPTAQETLQVWSKMGHCSSGGLRGEILPCDLELECISDVTGLVESHSRAQGLECSTGRHFVCPGDLRAYIRAFCAVDNRARQQGCSNAVKCYGVNCPGSFAFADLARCLPREVYTLVTDMARRTIASHAQFEQERIYREKRDKELLSKELQQMVAPHKQNIREEIERLRCPMCQTIQPTSGVTSLLMRCYACESTYCIVCLHVCTGRVHRHACEGLVACKRYYGRKRFKMARKRRIHILATQYLANLPHRLRKAVAAAVEPMLAHAGVTLTCVSE